MQVIAARPCFIAETQWTTFNDQLLHQLADVIRAVRNCPRVTDLAAAFVLGDRHRDRCLVDIQPDERAILHLVFRPFMRLGARQPGATLERRMLQEMSPTQSGHAPIPGAEGPFLDGFRAASSAGTKSVSVARITAPSRQYQAA